MSQRDRYLAAARKTSNPAIRKRYLTKARAEKLRTKINSCRACPLAYQRHHAVPWSGPYPAEIAVVGEAPGANEDREGVPFVGRAGELLDTVLEGAGTSRDRVFVCNTICCRPPNNRNPEHEELEACAPHFNAQLKLADTWMVVVMGRVALETMLGYPQPIGQVRGKPMWKDGRVLVPTYHPAYALRNPSAKDLIADDVGMAVALRRGTGAVRLPKPDWAELQKLAYTPDEMKKRFTRDSYVALFSSRLDSHLVMVEDESKMRKIPAKLSDLPVYTVDELVRLGELSRGGKMSVGDLRRLHMLKVEFDGTFIK